VAKTVRSSASDAWRSAPRRAYWRSLIAEYERSGLKQGEFCRRRGVVAGTFAFWKHTLAREARDSRTGSMVADLTPPTFLPVRVMTRPKPRGERPPNLLATVADGEIEIVLEDRRRVRVRGWVDPAWLGEILRTVETLGR
jgi:hypothetical protein